MDKKLKQATRLINTMALMWCFCFISFAEAIDLKQEPKLQQIADQLITQKIYTQKELDKLFEQVDFQQQILDAMQNPAEYRFTWGKYRKLFLQEDRIQRGVDFWQQYEPYFDKAEKEYGVPASMIAAIIGVESKYGEYKGKHKVLDSLATLVIGFERRSKFFGKELKEFLILCKDNGLIANNILGSYAGAVGFPQFISSSYRNYAVDFSEDGTTDLIDQPIDAIGSVANYFVKNGWLTGQAITSEAHESVPREVLDMISRERKVKHRADSLRKLGVVLDASIPNQEKLGVLMLNASEILPPSSDKRIYSVRAGDTACQIAEQHKVSCRELFKLNKLNSRGKIFRGQQLKMPQKLAKHTNTSSTENTQQIKQQDNSKWKINKPVVSNINQYEDQKYFFTHENFYVITRYNQSVLYAMAVNVLSVAIAAAKENREHEASNE